MLYGTGTVGLMNVNIVERLKERCQIGVQEYRNGNTGRKLNEFLKLGRPTTVPLRDVKYKIMIPVPVGYWYHTVPVGIWCDRMTYKFYVSVQIFSLRVCTGTS